MQPQSNIKISFIQIFLITTGLSLQSQTVTDYDGNVYQTIAIGNQRWIAENIKVTHYSDGTPLLCGSELEQIQPDDTLKYYFYYEDNSAFKNEYGLLYTWFSAMRSTKGSNAYPSGVQGICPDGWHIPSDVEWQELEIVLGMDSTMARNSTCWEPDRINSIANLLKIGSASGFEAKYAGVRDWDGTFNGLGYHGEFLTSYGERYEDESMDTYTRLYYIINNESMLYCHYHGTNAAYSVRCVSNTTLANTTTIKNLSLNVYPNPCKHCFNIDPGKTTIDLIELYTIDGRMVKSEKLKLNKSIDVSNLENGLYFIKIVIHNSIYLKSIEILK